MLSFLPGPIHRLALRTAHAVRLRFWRLTKRQVRGCNVIAYNTAGEVLLVRHSYHLQDLWMLPGGGLGRGEDPIHGAARELVEETGCDLTAPSFIGTVTLDHGTWTNIVELICGEATGEPVADRREIAEVGFHAINTLPEMLAVSTRQLIEYWLQSKSAQNGNSP